MFKRRDPRPILTRAAEALWPRGGWARAVQYMGHRIRRLPDPPHRVARGVASGVFVSFTPLVGLHFLAAAGLAWIAGGNIFASLIATFVFNPLTAPFIAVACVSLGRGMLGLHGHIGPHRIVAEMARATGEVGNNLLALIGPREANWGAMSQFFHDLFLPYLVGGAVLGALAAAVAHVLTVPLVAAYHRRRAARLARGQARRRPPAP